MAGLRHAQWRDTLDEPLSYDGRTTYRDDGSDVRPRIGIGAPHRRRQKKAGRLGRTLAIAAAALAVGTGGLLAVHLLVPGSAPGGIPSRAEQAEKARTPSTIDPRDQAVKVASLLGTKAVMTAAPAPSAKPAAAPSDKPGPASNGTPVPEAVPTKADFERPAFLEPRSTEEDDGPDDAPVATAFAAEAAPADDAPLPTPRPRAIASADDSPAKADPAEGGRSTRLVKSINLRSAPRKGASTIAVLESGTKVTLYSCKSWCEISTGEKRGFVYKDAIAQ